MNQPICTCLFTCAPHRRLHPRLIHSRAFLPLTPQRPLGGGRTMSSASDTDGGPQPATEFPCIIHERQNLQLCAVHTVNNLLQLSEDMSQGWTCGGYGIGDRTKWTYATKAELDTIADQLTVAENRLLEEPNSTGNDYTGSPSILQKISSQHRTLVFGNYSMEVWACFWNADVLYCLCTLISTFYLS